MAIEKIMVDVAEESESDLRQMILTNELGNRMLNMVAPIYNNSKAALYFFQAAGIMLQKEADFVANDFIAQMFPQTATWGLDEWEYEFGITTDKSKTLEQRRAFLMSVMFKKTPLTPYRIKQIVKGITGIDCDIYENYAPNTFKVTVRGYFKNAYLIRDVLEQKAPAHLNFIVQLAELSEMDFVTTSSFCVSEWEYFKVEVIQ